MKIIFIIGGTRELARQRLERIASDNGICRHDFYDELVRDDARIVALGGEAENVCYLRSAGFGVEIITVGNDGISEAMQRRIRHVRSTSRASREVSDVISRS